jgi:hypothetical protein
MTDWTPEEDEAFNDVEKQSNLGKQILRAQGQPYHWAAEATKAAVLIEREACARLCEAEADDGSEGPWDDCCLYLANKIRARGKA